MVKRPMILVVGAFLLCAGSAVAQTETSSSSETTELAKKKKALFAVRFADKAFQVAHARLEKAGYKTMGQLAEAPTSAVVKALMQAGFKFRVTKGGEVVESTSKKNKKVGSKVGSSVAKQLIRRAKAQKAGTPLREGTQKIFKRVRNDNNNEELLDNEWLITYDDTTDII